MASGLAMEHGPAVEKPSLAQCPQPGVRGGRRDPEQRLHMVGEHQPVLGDEREQLAVASGDPDTRPGAPPGSR